MCGVDNGPRARGRVSSGPARSAVGWEGLNKILAWAVPLANSMRLRGVLRHGGADDVGQARFSSAGRRHRPAGGWKNLLIGAPAMRVGRHGDADAAREVDAGTPRIVKVTNERTKGRSCVRAVGHAGGTHSDRAACGSIGAGVGLPVDEVVHRRCPVSIRRLSHCHPPWRRSACRPR